MKRKFLPGLLFFCLFYEVLLFGQSVEKKEFPRWQSYTSSNYVKDLVLDGNTIWSASGGVIKYNLKKGTWIKYCKEHGLAGNNVLKLALYNHTLWIATATGITRHQIEKNTWKSFYKKDGLPDDAITAITLDTANNSIWFGTWEGFLFSFDIIKEKWNFLPREVSIPDTMITSIVIDQSTGLLFVGTWGKGLYSYQPDLQLLLKKSLTIKPGIDRPSFDYISTLFIEHSKNTKKLWLGTVNNGLWIIDLKKIPATNSPGLPIPGKIQDIPGDWITDIDSSPGQDRVFVTTRSSGLYIYSRQMGQCRTISMKTIPMLPTNRLNACAVNVTTGGASDISGGDIFLGSEGEGIIRLNLKNKKLMSLKSTNEVANNKVSVITPDNRNHRIWVGTEGNGASRFDLISKTWTILNTENKVLSSDVVNCITVDKVNDAAWIGTDNGMVYCRVQGNTHRHYGLRDGLPSIMIYASVYDPSATLWTAFYYGSPAVFNPGTEKWQPAANLTGFVCYELCSDENIPSPSLWLATTGGIIQYDLKKCQTTNYWPQIEFRSLLVDTQKKTLWAGSWGKGLFHMAIDSQRQSQAEELANLSILDIKKDLQNNTIWFATNEGIFSLQANSNSFQHFTAADGLGMNYVLTIGITPDSIWFGTWGGGISRLFQ